jgi:hypothetical protein
MIIHVVLFRPHGHLQVATRRALSAAFAAAVREIPSVRRARVGRRVTHGRGYERLMRSDFPYVALLEFDDLAGLQAYLSHSAHEQLARQFYESFEEALMYDFDVRDGEEGIAAISSPSPG